MLGIVSSRFSSRLDLDHVQPPGIRGDEHAALRQNRLGQDPAVEAFARRIASFPPQAVRLAKEAVNSAHLPLAEGLAQEAYLFQRLMRTEDAQRNMAKFMEIGGQTREGELRVGELNAELGK